MNSALAVWCLPFIFLACSPAKTDMDLTSLKEKIQNKINAVPETVVAVAYKDLRSKKTLFIHEKEMIHAASTMKIPVMMEVFKQAASGRFQLTDSLLVKNDFHSIMDGSLYAMDIGEDSDDILYSKIGHKMSIHDLVFHMITASSNLATNILIEFVGAENVQKTMKDLGANDIRILRGVEDLKAYRAGKNNRTDAYDLLQILQAIAQKEFVSQQACEDMLKILFAQKYNTKIPAQLPKNTRVAHKTGAITKISHDCGIIYPADSPPYILVVLTKGYKNNKQAEQLIADISKQIYDFHNSLYNP